MTRRVPSRESLRVAATVNDAFDEVWANDLYDCQVRYLEPRGRGGALHLSIKRIDRGAQRDWRHDQSIKNEVAGWEREAIELYPAESRLVDGANQYHLWVLPAGVRVPLGFSERQVTTDAEMRQALQDLNIDPGKAKQRPWQPGLSTGPEYKP